MLIDWTRGISPVSSQSLRPEKRTWHEKAVCVKSYTREPKGPGHTI
jgi:hypothetical protein